NFYDAYSFLLSNDKNRISKSLLKKFYYIIKEEELFDFTAMKLSTKYFKINHKAPIEQAIEYHLYVYQELNELSEDERTIISLMIFNYILVKNKIPCIQILRRDYKHYEQARKAYFSGNKTLMLEFVVDVIKNNPHMNKSYYKNLIPVSLSDVIHFIEERKEELKKKYQIKGLWIHGSMAKKIERIDSDIDFFIEMSLDLLNEEKQALIDELKQVFFEEFKRMIDIHEIVEYLDDDIIKEARTTKRLI
ncbi:MAG: nucleotidyltransferase domain-containing protein, partial [Anaeroplasmataceae bacterium]|nr:nucleotidyltransferase domain-containing protein [Anaeroplasmataceae bacterium]